MHAGLDSADVYVVEKVQHALLVASTVSHCLNLNTAAQPFWKHLSRYELVVVQYLLGGSVSPHVQHTLCK